MPEKTRAQSVSLVPSFDGVLPPTNDGAWLSIVRLMRRHPTIALARNLAIAPALASVWSVESTDEAPEESVNFIKDQLIPKQLRMMRTAMLGNIDFGWQGFEKVFKVDGNKQVILHKMKPLLQDMTEILVDVKTGAFRGLRNTPVGGEHIDLDLSKSMLFSVDVEGTDWYGEPVMRNVEAAYNSWDVVNKAANRYDKKIAGSMWVVHYPLGTSMFQGAEIPNDEIADILLNAMESSGAIKVPRQIETLSADLDAQAPDAWKIELLSDKGAAKAAFIDRQNYLDKLMIRGFSMPERAVLEGQFGTKAEAEAHADFAITNIELRHRLFVDDVNMHITNQLMRLNYGERSSGTVWVAPTPLADSQTAFLKTVYTVLLGNPEGFMELLDKIDMMALSEKLGIPISPDAERDDNVDDSDL